MIQVNEKDYLIVRAGNKNRLARVLEVGDEDVVVKVFEGEKTVELDLPMKDVYANLGVSPKVGKVYGTNVEPKRRAFNMDFWGEVVLYVKYDKKQQDKLITLLTKTADKLLDKNLPEPNIIVHIKERTGKMAGCYKHTKGEAPDILDARPEHDIISGFDYVVSHEYAHGIWFNHITPKTRLRWIQLYHDYVQLSHVKSKDLEEILNAIVELGTVGAFLKDADPQDKIIVRSALRHVSTVHGISPQHFGLLLNMGEAVDHLWPKSLELGEKKLFVSDYARKSPEELFAESFAFWFTGHKLPKDAQSLLDRTLANLK